MFGPLLLLATLGVFAFGATATAVPINGTIDFTGSGTPPSGDALDFGANTVDVLVNVAATGDLAGVATTGFALSFTYDPFSDPLWSIDGFSFEATGGVATETILLSGAEDLAITNGTGILSHASYDDTNVLWTFGITELGEMFFGLTASAETDGGAGAGAPMPEPSAALLFLVGLSTVGCRVRRRR
jgi:hypothetical protein